MKTLTVCVTVAVNAAFLFLAAVAAVTADVPLVGRVIGGAVAVSLLAGVTLLLAGRFGKLPVRGYLVMRCVCLAVPLLWLFGSMDHGIISGQEWAFILFACVLMWGT